MLANSAVRGDRDGNFVLLPRLNAMGINTPVNLQLNGNVMPGRFLPGDFETLVSGRVYFRISFPPPLLDKGDSKFKSCCV